MLTANTQTIRKKPAAVLVVGGGIGGMRAALDLADSGLKVYLVEQTPCLGGRVAQLGFMFPQHDCVLCRGTPDHGYGCTRPSISPAYIQHNQHPNIHIMTNTRVVDVAGEAGDFSVSLRREPRHVDIERCTNCGICAEVCPVTLPDAHQLGMTTRKAAYKVAARATPDAYVIDKGPYCDDCVKCEKACPTSAIHLNEQPRLESIEVGAIILALGFQIYNATEMEELGYGRYPNVLQALHYERLASRSGPTEGAIVRPSDNKQPRSIAWLQCIGSRDQKNTFCSSICCMYATKEAVLAKQRLKDVQCSVFLMDERAFNKNYSAYFSKARDAHGVQYNRVRVSAVSEDPSTRDLILTYTEANGKTHEERFDMVVLATGLQPPESAAQLAEMLDIGLNKHGFCETDKFTPLQTTRPGVFVCGAFSSPKEIAETIIDASGAAAEVMRLLNDRINTYPTSREWPFLADASGFMLERDTSAEPPRVGVFACTCGDALDEDLDYPALIQQVSRLPGVETAEVLEFACFPEALGHIQERVQSAGLNRLVIAACSSRTHESLFQRTARQTGLNPYLLELVNLREQCNRVHKKQRDLANRKGLEMTRLAVGRVQLAQPIHKKKHKCKPSALVIGGGLAGMTAGLAIADSGYDVHLIERSERLGGNLLDLYYVAEGVNPQRLLRDLVNRIRAHQRIAVHTRTEAVNSAGHLGDYVTSLRTKHNGTDETFSVEHGVIIVATGAQEARRHPYPKFPGVITQHDLEEKIIHQPEEIAALKDVVMIQCVKPEDTPEYCSRVCCTNALKNAIRLKLFNPACHVTVLYKNIVTYGFREEYYTEARKLGVTFVRYTDEEPPQVYFDQDYDQLRVKALDLSLDRWLDLKAELVPISTSIVPSAGNEELARMLRVPLSGEGFFQEAQMKLRPMDFMREGVFLAGMAHYPKFTEESISHALAAAARAVTILSKSDSLYLGGVVAQVDPAKCVGCLTCTRTCPFGIPQIIYEEGRSGVGGLGGAAFIDSALCQGCGTCTGECPANAIQLVHYTDEQMMMRAIGGLGTWRQPAIGD